MISPFLGQIPRDLALPAHPPFRDLAPPKQHNQRIFLYLDAATKKASEMWFGNLTMGLCESEPILSDVFKSIRWHPNHCICDCSFAAVSLLLLCLILILPNLLIVLWVILVSNK